MSANGVASCKRCGKVKKIRAFGLCSHCYGYYGDSAHLKECPICKKMKPTHAKGICHNCYLKKYKYHFIKSNNIRKWHNGLSYDIWLSVTKKCIICGFDKCVDLHHMDRNKNNKSPENLVGLCPNHHKMVHTDLYHEEITKLVRKNQKV